ncbi:hypothetical protein BDV06DRAFT_227099 [Aspergillus oleicola]
MHFSKVAPVIVFAAIATASPLPAPQISVDLSQLQAIANTVQSFSSSIGAGINEIDSQVAVIAPNLGSSGQAIQQLVEQLNAAGAETQQISASFVDALNTASSSFSEADQTAADQLASAFGRRSAQYSEGESNTGVEHQSTQQTGTSTSDYNVGVPISADDYNVGVPVSADDYNVGVPVSGESVWKRGRSRYNGDVSSESS